LKSKHLFETNASRKQGVFVDLISLAKVLALQAAEWKLGAGPGEIFTSGDRLNRKQSKLQ
jgi:hypothetical protein